MKNIIVAMIIAFSLSTALAKAQVNWSALNKETSHLLNVNVGVEYGLTYGVGYGYHLKTKMPILLNVEYSFPSGSKLTDDFKTKFGAQVNVLELNRFRLSAKVYGLFRRYQNNYVRIANFGSDVALSFGLYQKRWFVAAEAGFDKAIVSNFKHSDLFKQNFPAVQDGWYEPATGGNFYYGVQGGYSFGRHDIYLKAGLVTQQDFKTKPTVPIMAQLGYNLRF